MHGQERLDVGRQPGVGASQRREPPLAFAGYQVQSTVEMRADALPARTVEGRHHAKGEKACSARRR